MRAGCARSSSRRKSKTHLVTAALHRGFLLQRGETRVVVRRIVKVEERLAHRAEVARREIRDAVETNLLRLDSIPNLTPGDFRTVSQSLFYLDDASDNNTRLAALEKESAMKGGGHKVCLGFSAR